MTYQTTFEIATAGRGTREITATSLSVPVGGGRLLLGTWQGIYLWEHRTAPHCRRLVVTVLGS